MNGYTLLLPLADIDVGHSHGPVCKPWQVLTRSHWGSVGGVDFGADFRIFGRKFQSFQNCPVTYSYWSQINVTKYCKILA